MTKLPDVGAMWLPGFHKDPKNDQWWGDGFTEWDNVLNSKPQYRGHHQPVLPLNGTYDLSIKEDLIRQFCQAAHYGVNVIGGYHYWFSGQRLLSKPEKILMSLDQLPVKYFSIWANHSWSRAWTNRSDDPETLIAQCYSRDDAKSHAVYLSNLASKEYYYLINGKPLIAIYNPLDIMKSCPDYLENFNEAFDREYGKPPTIAFIVRSVSELEAVYAQSSNYDLLITFEPSLSLSIRNSRSSFIRSIIEFLPKSSKSLIYKIYNATDRLRRYDYPSYADALENYKSIGLNIDYNVISSIFCGFDNTPRYGERARVFENYSTAEFSKNLEKLYLLAIEKQSPLVMINALNEWGEGMNLEPCNLYGYQKLESVLNVIEKVRDGHDYAKS